jgi:hypothetical protein
MLAVLLVAILSALWMCAVARFLRAEACRAGSQLSGLCHRGN